MSSSIHIIKYAAFARTISAKLKMSICCDELENFDFGLFNDCVEINGIELISSYKILGTLYRLLQKGHLSIKK